jgi:multidrug efflux pump subunit AcrA (membrane-fusion protein)
MDDRALNIELSGVSADHLKAVRQQSIDLADHNISNLQLANLEAQRLSADESLLRYRQRNLQIRSPIDGVVLSGSTERAEAASVRQGQVLFEIGSLHQQRIEVEIPATEIACVKVGQPVKVWVEGLEGKPIEGTIERILSQAELRNGKLVFVAEVPIVADQTLPVHPGMRGSARIDGDRNPIAWNLFRRPYELLRSYCAW